MPSKKVTKLEKFWSENQSSLGAILGVIADLISGLIAKTLLWPHGQQVDPNLIRILSLPGLLFIRAFLLLIIPLLVTSLSTSLFAQKRNSNATESNGIEATKLLLVTFAFFICFSLFAAGLGISLMATFKPGLASQDASELVMQAASNQSTRSDISAIQKRVEQNNFQTDSVYNIILSIFPDNLISAMFMNSFTTTEVIWPANLSEITEPSFVPILRQRISHTFKANMLGVCAISLLLGMLLQQAGPSRTTTIRQLLRETELLVRESMAFLLKLMPAGMFCWMFTEALKMHSITQVAGQLFYFYAITLAAFAIVLLLFYPLVCFLFTHQNPFRLYSHILPAILVAVGSCSSAITLPLTMRCMQEKGGLSPPVAQSVLPLGMTLHMNGTALYYPVVALFVAQMKNIEVDTFSMVVLCLFSAVYSMGLPASPAGGSVIVNHITFAAVIGIDNPTDVLAYILAFEWIMERVRTPVNVIGDCFASKCIQSLVFKNIQNDKETPEVDECTQNESTTEC